MSTIASEYATRKRQLGYGGEPSEPAPNVAASVARAPPPPATTFAVSQRWRAGRDTRLKARASAKKARQPRADGGRGGSSAAATRKTRPKLGLYPWSNLLALTSQAALWLWRSSSWRGPGAWQGWVQFKGRAVVRYNH